MFAIVPILTALARAEGVTSTVRPLAKTRVFEGRLVMVIPLLRGRGFTRNSVTALNISPNSSEVKRGQAAKLVLPWDILSKSASLSVRLGHELAATLLRAPLAIGGAK